jgi:hypothetical protein
MTHVKCSFRLGIKMQANKRNPGSQSYDKIDRALTAKEQNDFLRTGVKI